MEQFITIVMVGILMCVGALAGALIAAHFERIYTGALLGLLLGPVGVFLTLCAAACVQINQRDPWRAANIGFAIGPLGILVAWYERP